MTSDKSYDVTDTDTDLQNYTDVRARARELARLACNAWDNAEADFAEADVHANVFDYDAAAWAAARADYWAGQAAEYSEQLAALLPDDATYAEVMLEAILPV